jgi:hypothetical protein
MDLRTRLLGFAPVLFPLLLAACSTQTSYMHDASPSSAPGAGQAKVVVFRPSSFAGTTQFPIYEYAQDDATLMGFAESGCYFEYLCPAGRHLFLTWGEGEAFIEAELAPDKTYFVRCFARFGVITPRPAFSPVALGSEEMKILSEELKGLKCRELDACSADSYAEAKEERARKAKQSHDEGRKAPRILRPEDGR